MQLDRETRAVLIAEAQRMAGVLPLGPWGAQGATLKVERVFAEPLPCQGAREWFDRVQREMAEPKPDRSRWHQVEALCKADKASEAVELLLADLEDVRRRLRGDGDA